MTAQHVSPPRAAPLPPDPGEALRAGFRAALWGLPRDVPPYWIGSARHWLRGFDMAKGDTRKRD